MLEEKPDATCSFDPENWSDVARLIDALGARDPIVRNLLADRSLGPDTARLVEGLPQWFRAYAESYKSKP